MEHRRPRDALSCDRCRAKKLKCSKDAPICTSCAHSGSHCHYSGKVARSPLTRAYLTSVEKRLHSLESLVTQLLPGVDVEDLLSSSNVAGTARSVIQSQTPEVAPSPQGSTNSSTHEPALPEAVPNNVDGFNWQEEDVNVDGLTDGMAALSVEPTGVGYLALGAWTLNNDQIGLEDYLYRRALTLGQEESVFEAASLTSVQALILLSNLSQKRNSPNTGWNLLGLAVRTALSLALHRELPHWNITLIERETRRRVWWGLYIFDSGASTTFGRAIMLPDQETMDVHSVLNIKDEVRLPNGGDLDDSLTPQTVTLPTEVDEATIYSSLRAQSSFHLQTNHISNKLLAEPGLSAEAALALNSSVDAWTHTVPPYFQLSRAPSSSVQWYVFARSRLWWRFWNLKIIIFRQILLRRAISERGQIPDQATQSTQEDCKRICLEAAHSTVVSIHQYAMQELNRLEGWYAT
ncbi:unnamed protein product [Alternaria alternata]